MQPALNITQCTSNICLGLSRAHDLHTHPPVSSLSLSPCFWLPSPLCNLSMPITGTRHRCLSCALDPLTHRSSLNSLSRCRPRWTTPPSPQSIFTSTHRTSNQPHPLLKLPSSPSVPSLRRKNPNFSSPASYNMSSRPNPLASSPSNFSKTLSTHLSSQALFPTAFKQPRVTPQLKEPTLNTSLIEKYRPVSLLPFIAKTLKRVVFNQVSLFLSQNNKLDTKQSGFRSGHSTETADYSQSPKHCKLQKPIPNHQSSFCWISLPLLTLSIIRSSCPPSHHFAGLNPISLVGLSGWHGEESKAHQLVTGVPQGSVLGPLLFSTYTTSLGPIIQAHGFCYCCCADDTQLYLSFRPDDPMVAARISGCLTDITYSSTWQRLSFLSFLPLQLYSMTSRFI